MKKTLAAVLAAAMALSTATVAMATDLEGDPNMSRGDLDSSSANPAIMGDTTKYLINNITMEDGSTILGSELAQAIEDGYLTPTVAVTSNQNKLDGRPVINTGKRTTGGTSTETIKVKTYKWTTAGATTFKAAWAGVDGIDVNKIANEREITFVVLNAVGDAVVTDIDEDYIVVRKGDNDFEAAVAKLVANDAGNVTETYKTEVTSNNDAVTNKALRLSFKVNHTYGIDDVTVKMKIRFTVKKIPKGESSLELGGESYSKGDTITSEELSFKAKYNELSNYYEDMQLTSSEVSANNVILDGAALYDVIGAKKFTISFGDDVAIFEGKAAPNQKKVNLYWSLAEIDEIKDQYPDVDFTFLTFKGNPAPSFQNTGKMYFAAADKDYQVYSWDGEVLEPLTGKFDSTYKVIEVNGIKKLGTYVIADQILEVEEEPEEPDEPAEPVSSAPTTEPDDEGGNPNTGAC